MSITSGLCVDGEPSNLGCINSPVCQHENKCAFRDTHKVYSGRLNRDINSLKAGHWIAVGYTPKGSHLQYYSHQIPLEALEDKAYRTMDEFSRVAGRMV